MENFLKEKSWKWKRGEKCSRFCIEVHRKKGGVYVTRALTLK
jgi:hypothetical protein